MPKRDKSRRTFKVRCDAAAVSLSFNSAYYVTLFEKLGSKSSTGF